jgi:hypothetical protein
MSQSTTFDDRLSRIQTKHRHLSVGVIYRVGPDGLLIPVPRRRIAPRFPLKALLLLAVTGYAFKIALFLGLGEEAHAARLDLLRESGPVGEAAAWALRPDAATQAATDLAAQAQAAWLELR